MRHYDRKMRELHRPRKLSTEELIRDSEQRKIAVKLDPKFQILRTRMLEEAFAGRQHYGHLIGVPSDKARFFESANEKEGWDNPFPWEDYFIEEIFPTAQQMTKNPEEMEAICEDAFKCLEFLLANKSRADTFLRLVRTFFKPLPKEKMETVECDFRFGKNYGQFEYFYRKFGRHGALACAALQGEECDLHYDGSDYSKHTTDIDRMCVRVLAHIPPEHHADALEAFTNYGGSYSSKAFWGRLPAVIDAITGAGKQHLLPQFFQIAKATPKVDPQNGDSRNFPVTEPEKVLAELTAIESMPMLQSEGVDFATQILKLSGRYHQDACPTFLGKKNEGYRMMGFNVNVPQSIQQLIDAGKSEDDVRKILREIPQQVPSVGFLVVNSYPAIDKQFPGGVDGLVKYLAPFKNAPNCARRLVLNFRGDGEESPQQNLDTYLEMGTRVVTSIGDDGASYFDDFKLNRPLGALLEAEPEKFAEQVQAAIDFSSGFAKDADNQGVSRITFDHHLRYSADTQFPQFLEGMNLIISEKRRLMPQKPGRRDYRDSECLREALDKYSHCFFCLDQRHRGKLAYDDPMQSLLPPGVDCVAQAKILVQLFLVEDGGGYGRSYYNYMELLGKGVHYLVAASAEFTKQGGSDEDLEGIRDISTIDASVPQEKIRQVLDVVFGIRKALAKTYGCNQDRVEWEAHRLNERPRRQAVAMLPHNSPGQEELQRQLALIEGLEKDPETRDLANFCDLRTQINQAQALLFLKETMDISILHSPDRAFDTGLLQTTNPDTKSAIASMGLLTAIGAIHVAGVSEQMERLPIPGQELRRILPGNGEKVRGGMGLPPALQRHEGIVMNNLGIAIPQLAQMVLEDRKRTAGQMSEGGKLHTPEAMNPRLLTFLQNILGLDSTAFHLAHAGGSLVLPPLPSPLELKFLVSVLDKFGMLGSTPDLQLAMAGRWSKETAAIVGASILLATTRGVQYKPGAFSTTHTKTGKRIMAYDDGVKRGGLPFDLPAAKGRTDMLGRHDLGDADRYQLLGTLASHHEFGGPLAGLFEKYATEFMKILFKHGLLETLMSSAWVFDHAQGDTADTAEHHETMVRTFTQAWAQASDQIGFGVIAEVNWLLAEMEKLVEIERPKMIASQPEEYAKLMSY